MSCPPVTTLEQAEAPLPPLFPVQGLRRNADDTFTDDAKNIIVDSIKSVGVDLNNPATRKKLLDGISEMSCNVNNQYEFLLKEIGVNPDRKDIKQKIKEKNIFLLDLITMTRHFNELFTVNDGSQFKEGWQNTESTPTIDRSEAVARLAVVRKMLEEGWQDLEVRKEMVQISGEKNKIASNYLGLYGFLNLVAIGLIIYVAGSR